MKEKILQFVQNLYIRANDPQLADKARKQIICCIAMILAFTMLLGICVTSASSHILQQSVKEQQIDLLHQSLNSVSKNIDNIYRECIDKPMTNMFESDRVLAFAFSSLQYPPTPNLQGLLRSELSSFISGSALVSDAFIYASGPDMYVTCNYNLTPELKDYYEGIIYAYNSGTTSAKQVAFGEELTFMFQHNGRDIIAKNITQRNGTLVTTLFFIIDVEEFSAMLLESFDVEEPIQINVYDSNHNLLFANYDDPVPVPRETLITLSASRRSATPVDGNYLLYFSSNILTWEYVAVVPAQMFEAQTQLSLMSFILLTVIFLSAVIGLTVYILYRLRIPLESILASLTSAQITENTDAGSLIRYSITKSASITDELLSLRNIIEATSDNVITNLFSRLIVGEHLAPEYIRTVLSVSKSGCAETDSYVSCALRCSNAHPLNIDQQHELLACIQKAAEDFRKNCNITVISFQADLQNYPIILRFPPEISIAEGISQTKAFSKYLCSNLYASSFRDFTLKHGHLYHSVADVGFSYSEAVRALDAAPAAGIPTVTETEHIPEADASTEGMLSRRADHMVSLIYNGKTDEANILLKRILPKIFVYDDPSTQLKILIDNITERIVSYEFINAKQIPNTYSELSAVLQQTDPLQWDDTAYEKIQELFTSFSDALSKQRNPYIIAAQQYVELHYSDPDLSLESIADSIGISANYLSGLFSKNLGQKLVDYVNAFRINKSMDTLLNSSETITNIATAYGFSSARNYIRVFKKIMDTTPGDYRRSHTANES